MQNLCDIIPAEDKECMMQWINSYANCFPDRIETVLRKWSENKKTLYRALGKNLRISYPIKVKKDEKVYYRELTEIYKPLPKDIRIDTFDRYYEDTIENNHVFIRDLYNFFLNKYKNESGRKGWEIRQNLSGLSRLLSYSCIQHNKYEKGPNLVFYNAEGKTKTIKPDARAIRAIQGVLKFIGYNKMENFDAWRNRISDLNNARSINCNLIFSIHPLDFMTMSDNTCNWRSCMNWQTPGSCSAGTIEMLNSNNTMVVYLESPKQFIWNDHIIPNKSWRCLFYVHKNIICLGKSYPYYNKNLNLEVLKIAQQFLKENLNWKYQYKNQEYKDLIKCYSNNYVREDVSAHNYYTRSHKIYLYTYGMYPDLIEDKESVYWCCRNWVKDDLKICVSGRATCMNCGEYLDDEMGDFSLSESSRKYCCKCEHSLCHTCKNVNSNVPHYYINLFRSYISFSSLKDTLVCEDCLKNDIFYDEGNGFFVHINDRSVYERTIEHRRLEKPSWIHASELIGTDKIIKKEKINC